METIHRYNTRERQHYLLEKHYSFKLKPRLLYVGSLNKQGGWREEPHSHAFVELVFVLDGKGSVIVDGKECAIGRGDMLVYNAGVEHFEKSSMEEPLEVQFIAYDKLEITDLPKNWLLPPAYGFLFQTGDMFGVFQRYFHSLIDEFERKEQFYVEITQNVSCSLLMYLFRLINQTENATGLLNNNRTLDLALRYIDEHYHEELTLEDLAAECFANKYYLSHLFSRTQNQSVGKYILNKRISTAKQQLTTTDRTVSDIAEAVGFHDVSYFCRVFKKETGQTPLQYRNRT